MKIELTLAQAEATLEALEAALDMARDTDPEGQEPKAMSMAYDVLSRSIAAHKANKAISVKSMVAQLKAVSVKSMVAQAKADTKR